MIGDYFTLAFKNLRHRGIRSWLTLLGIFMGVMAVVALISLSSGLKTAIVSQFGVENMEVITIQAGGLSGYGPPGSGVTEPLTKEDVEAIDTVPGVDFAIGRIISTAKIEFNKKTAFAYMASIPLENNLKNIYETIGLEIEQGRQLKEGDYNKVVIGYNLYENEDTFEKAISLKDKISVNDQKFEVVGIAKKKGSFLLDNIIIMPEDPIRDLLGNEDGVDIILVKVKSSEMMDKVKEDIEKLMRRRRNVEIGKENFEVSTPEATLEMVNTILGGVQAFIVIIASISIVVGAIGIVNTMTTSVLERRREIGIMKAVGAKNSQIFFQFFTESGLLGLVGGIVGVALGLLIGQVGIGVINSFLGAEVPLDINLFLIIGTLAGSFIIGSISGIVPAMNAAKQNPVEALR
jgi:putative ABC transport system permease protein